MVRRNSASGNVHRENDDSTSSSSNAESSCGWSPSLGTDCSSRMVLSMTPPLLRRVKRVVIKLFTHRGARTVSRQEQAIFRQSQDVPSDRFKMSMIELSGIGSSDRAGKERIAHERDRTPRHLDTVANPARRMTWR